MKTPLIINVIVSEAALNFGIEVKTMLNYNQLNINIIFSKCI